VTQPTGDVITTEGETVTLGCTFETTLSPTLYWYKQEVNDFPKMMLQRFSVKTDDSEDKTKILLQISSAAVTDSAVYYCAGKPTVTGNTKTLHKNLWSKDNKILHNIH
uniref:Ig-like domain-containing protein n=1 Tax=Sander lucioperca TaxID=283035 RepID=A0A8C9ZK04_SANLU